MNIENLTLNEIKQVISSPLNRALETAVQLFHSSQRSNVKIAVWPELTSSRGGEGENLFELQRRYGPEAVDLSRMQFPKPVSQVSGIAAVKNWLLQQRDHRLKKMPYEIVVVGHTTVFKELIPSKYSFTWAYANFANPST